jgi:hypothetical protein
VRAASEVLVYFDATHTISQKAIIFTLIYINIIAPYPFLCHYYMCACCHYTYVYTACLVTLCQYSVVILSQKCHMNMGLILYTYGAMDVLNSR